MNKKEIQYCLPFIQGTKSEVLDLISKHKGDFSMFEIWLEYVRDITPSDVAAISKDLGDRAIFVIRRRDFESPERSKEEREQIIRALSGAESYLDLDVFNQADQIQFIKDNSLNVNLVISFHNYEMTPVLSELKMIAEKIQALGPEILKISTMCNSKEDALDLLRLVLDLKDEGHRFVVLGMGEHGVVTRIFGTVWGNEYTYCPLTKERASAPGQLTYPKLKAIFDALS